MDPCTASSKEHDVSLGTIRSWWKVPAISHFCSLFRTTFKLPDFEIEELEEALYQDSEVNRSRFLIDLLTALLKGSFETDDIDDDNYSDYLRDICNIHWEKENRVNPLNNEDTSFQSLSTLMKVEILYTLCDYRLDADDVSILKDYDGETLRVEPLGVDSKGMTYWYFYGTRLYREEVPPPRPPKKKQKKRKKKKKRCFLQALRKNLAFSQSLISEDDEPVPEPPPKKRKGRTGKVVERKGTKGKEKMTSATGRKKKRNNDAAESESDDEDDDVPLAKMASPPGKKSKGASATTKKRGKRDDDEKVTSKRGAGRKATVPKDVKRQTNKEGDYVDRRKKSARGQKMTKKEIARLEAEAAKQKRVQGKGQKGKRRGNHSETDESISLADMKRSNVNGKGGKNVKRKNSGKGAPTRGSGNRQEDSSDEEYEAERPSVKKKRPPPVLLLPSWSNDEGSSSSSESSSSEEEPEPAKWQVICQTEEDWQTLTDSFKKSKSKCEKELYQVLSENFLPAIHSLFTAKERELRRKLQDLAPKRTSSRIAVRRSKQEEEEKVRALMEYEEEQRQKAEEASRREFELTERRRKVQAEERRKAAEELKEKEDRQKLRSLRRHERLVERRNPSAKQKKRSLYEGFKKVLEAVKKHPDAWPFVDPVQESFAPAYYDIIKSPMDISTVEVKVQEEMYRSKAKFEADVELIFSNCMEYNGPESEYTMMGANVASCFQESLDQHFPPGSISDGELSDIASDQDSAYCLSYPRELRRRSKALNYTEMESTSDSGDTGKDEDDEERAEERMEERTKEGPKVFPSYMAEKGRREIANKENSSVDLDNKDCNSKSVIQNHKLVKSGSMKSETEDLPSPRDKAENRKLLDTGHQRSSENPSPAQNKEMSVTSSLTCKKTIVKSKQQPTVAPSPKKVSPKRPKTSNVASEGKSVKVKVTSAKESCTANSDGASDKSFTLDSCSSNSELTSLQRLEAITDLVGKSLETTKNSNIKSTHSVSNKIEDSSPVKGSLSKPSPVTKVKEGSPLSDSSVKPFNRDIKSVPISPSKRTEEPPVKVKSEAATCDSCSHTHSQPPKNSLPEVASPLVVPSNLSTVYNPVKPSDPLSSATKSSSSISPSFLVSGSPLKAGAGFHLPAPSTSAGNTYFAHVASRPSTVNSPKVGEGDAPRSLPGFRTGKSNHFSAFHSVGKDHGLSRPRIENSVDTKQSPFSGQLMQAPSQVSTLSHHGNKALPYSTFGSTGKTNFTAQQATTSSLNNSSSPFQSPKTYPNQPTTIVRPVSRYPAQAQAIRQNQYLLQSGAISNPTPSMGPQLNILQIASAPSLTLNIQPNGLLNNQPVVNVATSRQTVGTGIYGQGMNSVSTHMVQNSLQQKPTLVVQYQGAAGETPPYNAQFRASYQ